MYEHKSVEESIHEDARNHECFFDKGVFARELVINGRKATGILTQSKRTREYDAQTGMLSRAGKVLLLKVSDVSDVRVNETLRIGNRSYIVKEAGVISGCVWRIELGAIEP